MMSPSELSRIPNEKLLDLFEESLDIASESTRAGIFLGQENESLTLIRTVGKLTIETVSEIECGS